MKQGNLLQFGMRFLPAEGEIAADSPAVTPATCLIRQPPANCGQQQQARQLKGSKGSSTRAARRLQGPWLYT